mmetsp:Transcript_33721/g.61060  ORF Transcript_33721/g.61060 Transcript_33721/m.61060 type:complete len:634 (+) Transcript_33721:44-1945(+)|eukprot:CAMPEP_0197660456 /NCGR_PEP_ID=MMETSP1338-20131121/50854_1 /TAXON_ID=43686 ORGANISM="Pelagodinium beii, Strain RCC1491" /NCGR_SAMPLE_ID=MMETSP1338 /ASSEMBLY_ACC=CAM_ASM_000754 /LENGTH=633 /DNA_ID=CAMNT_0043237807 /DNA_START=43 /DNA_END=1944 /DNA_ORIENTATION=+
MGTDADGDGASPTAAGSGGAEKAKTTGFNLNNLADSSPRVAAVLDAPLANPIFMSDAPNFLNRQRTRAARALVSEHTGTITCPCQKCADAAKSRAGPAVSSAWPLPPLTVSESSKPSTAGPISISIGLRRSPTSKRFPEGGLGLGSPLGGSPRSSPRGPRTAEERRAAPRDFIWLLRVLHGAAPQEVEIQSGPAPVAGVVNYDGSFTPDPGSFLGKIGVLIPETVILDRGKPLKRYALENDGRIKVTKMKTSAELLRVLRDFVRKATRPRENMPRRISRQIGPSEPGLRQSKSEGSLQAGASKKAGSKTLPSDLGRGLSASPLTEEVAILHYNDGMSRLMMGSEAISQMKGASKLPREFWQHIRILQVPVQSKVFGVPTRYITYGFDSNNHGMEPQEPMPLGGGPRAQLRNPNPGVETEQLKWAPNSQPNTEAARLAAVVHRVNKHLSERAEKMKRQGLQIMSGQFEFVLDEADGMLWLVNASNIIVKYTKAEADEKGSTDGEDVIKLFEEDEFDEELREQENSMQQLKKRFGGDPGVAHGGTGAAGIAVSASDQLAGVTVPPNLVRYYEEEEKMLNYYKDEVIVMAMMREKPVIGGPRAVGLGCWFRRWTKAMKAKQNRQKKRASITMGTLT